MVVMAGQEEKRGEVQIIRSARELLELEVRSTKGVSKLFNTDYLLGKVGLMIQECQVLAMEKRDIEYMREMRQWIRLGAEITGDIGKQGIFGPTVGKRLMEVGANGDVLMEHKFGERNGTVQNGS
jgi:hypothetical protein